MKALYKCSPFTIYRQYYMNVLTHGPKNGCSFNLYTCKSNQIKSLLLSHHHSTSALVSEILVSVLQTVQKNNRQFTYGQTVQKKKKNNLHMDRQCKKNNKQFTYGQTVQKKQQTIYIWTDSAKKTTNNLHMDRQCKKTTAIYIWTVHVCVMSG